MSFLLSVGSAKSNSAFQCISLSTTPPLAFKLRFHVLKSLNSKLKSKRTVQAQKLSWNYPLRHFLLKSLIPSLVQGHFHPLIATLIKKSFKFHHHLSLKVMRNSTKFTYSKPTKRGNRISLKHLDCHNWWSKL